jgi:hypothetical protein
VKFGHNPFELLGSGNFHQPRDKFPAQPPMLPAVGNNHGELGFFG